MKLSESMLKMKGKNRNNSNRSRQNSICYKENRKNGKSSGHMTRHRVILRLEPKSMIHKRKI